MSFAKYGLINSTKNGLNAQPGNRAFPWHHCSTYLCHHHLIGVQLFALPFSQSSFKLLYKSLCLPNWKINKGVIERVKGSLAFHLCLHWWESSPAALPLRRQGSGLSAPRAVRGVPAAICWWCCCAVQSSHAHQGWLMGPQNDHAMEMCPQSCSLLFLGCRPKACLFLSLQSSPTLACLP